MVKKEDVQLVQPKKDHEIEMAVSQTKSVALNSVQILNTLKSGFIQISKNKTPAYEVISGAAIAFAAILLIIPGFLTDIFGFLLILPFSRKFIFSKLERKFKTQNNQKNNFIDGEYEDIEDDDDRKI